MCVLRIFTFMFMIYGYTDICVCAGKGVVDYFIYHVLGMRQRECYFGEAGGIVEAIWI